MQKPHDSARRTLLAGLVTATVSLNACSNHAGIDSPAPPVSFKTLKNAEPKPLADLGKPLLVNFWSTTCGVCLAEMPHLSAIYREYQPKGFEMVAVAMPSDRPSDVVEMSESGEWPFLVALDFDGKVGKAFGDIRVTPTSFLIDENGILVEKMVGAIDLKKLSKRLGEMTAT